MPFEAGGDRTFIAASPSNTFLSRSVSSRPGDRAFASADSLFMVAVAVNSSTSLELLGRADEPFGEKRDVVGDVQLDFLARRSNKVRSLVGVPVKPEAFLQAPTPHGQDARGLVEDDCLDPPLGSPAMQADSVARFNSSVRRPHRRRGISLLDLLLLSSS